MRRIVATLLLLIGLLYPFAVYYGLEYFSARSFALVLGGLWGLRAVFSAESLNSRWQTLALIVFFVVLFVFDTPELLRWYPVYLHRQ